jgi:hypothetical protein
MPRVLDLDASIADALERASGVIRERGWWRGKYLGDHGEVCVLGALQVVYYGHAGSDVDNPPDDVTDFLEQRAFDDPESAGAYEQMAVLDPDIAEWNDHPDRTVEEVISLLERSAARAREAGL